MKKEVEKGFIVAYDKTNGDLGFIGIDDHSGGYPFFSDKIETRNIKSNFIDAFKDAKNVVSQMKTYYGREKVKFDTVRVVRYSQVFEDVAVDVEQQIFDNIVNKLSKYEQVILKKYI